MSQSSVVLEETGSTNTLAATVREAMTAGDTTLSVLTNDNDPNVGVVSQTLSVSAVTSRAAAREP